MAKKKEENLVEEAEKVFEKEFTLESQIEEANNVVRSLYDENEIFQKVSYILNELINQLNRSDWNRITGDAFARYAMKLSVYNITIGSMAAEATMKANMAYGFKKFTAANEWMSTKVRISRKLGKVTDSDVKNELEARNWVNFKKEMEEKMYADKLVALNDGIGYIINALGYRMKQLIQERATTSHNS